jgi:hypothetical protein
MEALEKSVRLDPNTEILSGVTGRHLRELFRTTMQLMVCNVADFFGMGTRATAKMLVELERLGYVEPDPLFGERQRRSSDIVYRPTALGNAVAKARFTKPMSCSRADRYIVELIKRASEAVTMPFSRQFVEVQLFGSAVDRNRRDIGDIDIAVGLAPRFPLDVSAQQAADHARSTAASKGRDRGSFLGARRTNEVSQE